MYTAYTVHCIKNSVYIGYIHKVMKFASAFLALGLAMATPVVSKNMGSIQVDGVGTIYVVAPDWSAGNVAVHDNGFTLSGGGRIYLASKPADDFSDPFMYWQAPLIGQHFSYEIDVSNVGCHCNAAGYFIQMPGYDESQNPTPGDGGDWYCDANFVGGNWCPEYDTYEGNKYTMVSTLHTCNYIPPNDYNGCDGSGCGSNAFNVNSNLMCPEDRCTINTNRPYTISHFQGVASDGTMNVVNNRYSQEGRTADFNVCNDGNYVKNMGYSLGGIVFSASLWGGPGIDMGWLDGMTGCGGDCNIGGSSVTFRNFALSGGGEPSTTHKPGTTHNPTQPSGDCSSCPNSKHDAFCADPPTDPNGGLGCNACGKQLCRFCGYGVYPAC